MNPENKTPFDLAKWQTGGFKVETKIGAEITQFTRIHNHERYPFEGSVADCGKMRWSITGKHCAAAECEFNLYLVPIEQPEPAPDVQSVGDAGDDRHLAEWAESLLCNAKPMSHCTQEEWDHSVRDWRELRHSIYPDGRDHRTSLRQQLAQSAETIERLTRERDEYFSKQMESAQSERLAYDKLESIKSQLSDRDAQIHALREAIDYLIPLTPNPEEKKQ